MIFARQHFDCCAAVKVVGAWRQYGNMFCRVFSHFPHLVICHTRVRVDAAYNWWSVATFESIWKNSFDSQLASIACPRWNWHQLSTRQERQRSLMDVEGHLSLRELTSPRSLTYRLRWHNPHQRRKDAWKKEGNWLSWPPKTRALKLHIL